MTIGHSWDDTTEQGKFLYVKLLSTEGWCFFSVCWFFWVFLILFVGIFIYNVATLHTSMELLPHLQCLLSKRLKTPYLLLCNDYRGRHLLNTKIFWNTWGFTRAHYLRNTTKTMCSNLLQCHRAVTEFCLLIFLKEL